MIVERGGVENKDCNQIAFVVVQEYISWKINFPTGFNVIIKIRYLLAIFFLAIATASLPALAAPIPSSMELNAEVQASLDKLYAEKPAAKVLGNKAKGILVFPTVVKGGFFIGGEFGDGALLINKQFEDYYRTISASFGLQAGAQSRTQIIMFMTDDSLKKFRNSSGWEAGVDGSIAIAQFGAGGTIDTQTSQAPIVGFITDNKGLMYNLTLEGTKITKIKK